MTSITSKYITVKVRFPKTTANTILWDWDHEKDIFIAFASMDIAVTEKQREPVLGFMGLFATQESEAPAWGEPQTNLWCVEGNSITFSALSKEEAYIFVEAVSQVLIPLLESE